MLGLSLLFNSGCPAFLIGGAAGGGAVGYFGGELKSTEEVSLNRAWNATQQAMKDLGFTITSKEKHALNSQLIAKGAANKRIKIKLNKQSNMLTEIRIRVGTFGDESLSLKILERIKKRF
jgi:RNA binding exosome subunit